MGHKYRTREKIIYELLTKIKDKKGVIASTELMYRVFLSHYQLKAYLKRLEEKELIRRDPQQHSRLYITEKGKKYLTLLEQLNTFLDKKVKEPYLTV